MNPSKTRKILQSERSKLPTVHPRFENRVIVHQSLSSRFLPPNHKHVHITTPSHAPDKALLPLSHRVKSLDKKGVQFFAFCYLMSLPSGGKGEDA
jgi:hypothetical protein